MFRKRSTAEEKFLAEQKNVKSKINQNLAHTVKELQKECTLSTSPLQSESSLAQHLCSVVESAFIHGLKVSYYEKDQVKSTSKKNFPKPQFWNLIIKVSHAETVNRVQALTYITSKIGKCRAWLRLTLNDGAVTSYLASILSKEQKSILLHYYDQHAFFLDQEFADIFLRYLQGIESVLFDLSYNSSMLNQWTKTPLELAGLIPPSTTAPLYIGIQASVNNNNHPKQELLKNGRLQHRGSAPALMLYQYSQSLPPSRIPNTLFDRKKEIQGNQSGQQEEDKIDASPEEKETPSEHLDEDGILHRRHLLKKKKRRKKLSFASSGVLDSWSSLSSDSGNSGSIGSNSRRNTQRSNSFCETPAITKLMKKANEMSEKRPSTSDLTDGLYQFKSNGKKTPSNGRKKKNRNSPTDKQSPTSPQFAVGSVEPFTSFPPEVAEEQNKVQGTESALEDSTSSSGKVDEKLSSQIPLSDAYNISYVSRFDTSVSSEEGQNPGEYPKDQLQTPETLTTRSSTEAIDIYSNSIELQNARNLEDLHLDLSTPSRVGNSLSFGGGWSSDQSAANTPLSLDRSTKSNIVTPVANIFFPQSTGTPNDNKPEPKPVKRNISLKFSPDEKLSELKENEKPEVFIRREGYLKKLGETLKVWKQRWFVLHGTIVQYYKDKKCEELLGSIDLTDALTISSERTSHGADVEIVMNDGSRHHLAAENRTLTLDWASDFRQLISGPISPKSKDSSNSTGSYLEEYEVISATNHLLGNPNTSWHASMIAHMSKIANEKGLDSQNYQCADCASPIGIIYGRPRLCAFTGQNYCSHCHLNEESQIPARMIHNWDFRKHKVSKRSKSFLEQVVTDPLINLNETNPGIYRYIDEMGKVLELREQLKNLKPYLQTCREFDLDEITHRLGRRIYFLDDSHLYSVNDIVSVQDKSLVPMLNKIVTIGTKHIYGCELCKAKGFLCEICNSDKIIFPFETQKTVQCFECKSVFHRGCKTETQNCPKCERRQRRCLKNMEEEVNRYTTESDSDKEN